MNIVIQVFRVSISDNHQPGKEAKTADNHENLRTFFFVLKTKANKTEGEGNNNFLTFILNQRIIISPSYTTTSHSTDSQQSKAHNERGKNKEKSKVSHGKVTLVDVFYVHFTRVESRV